MPDKQAVTGRTKDATAFPLTVQFTHLSRNLSLGDLYSPSHSLPTCTPSHVTTGTTSTAAPLCNGDMESREDMPQTERFKLHTHMYMYTCIYVHVHVHVYVHCTCSHPSLNVFVHVYKMRANKLLLACLAPP